MFGGVISWRVNLKRPHFSPGGSRPVSRPPTVCDHPSLHDSPEHHISCFESWAPEVMTLGGGSFQRYLSHEGGALGINALKKNASQSSLAPFTMEGCSKKSEIWSAGRPHLTILALWSLASRLQNCEQWISAPSKPPLWLGACIVLFLVTAAQMD